MIIMWLRTNYNYLFSCWLHQCITDGGSQGDGMTKGSCYEHDEKCHADGTCSVCAVLGMFPHSGCSEPNPLCSGGSCKCTSTAICESSTASVCENVDIANNGVCKCGLTGNSGSGAICSGTAPKCNGAGNSATCQVGFWIACLSKTLEISIIMGL